MSIKYRPDIDGLRAIAVLSVIVYHIFPSTLPGGFVGVDIFFVISGYLITNIIYSEALTNKFSYTEFYKRRALRIFPSLIAVLAASLIYGWFFLLQSEYASLGKNVFTGAFFVANIGYILESGYFDTASELKPLLHLWSLGVEEQFYIIWPALILLIVKRKNSARVYIMLLFIASLLYCIYETIHNQSVSYYSPLTRLWELMTGAAISLTFRDGGNRKSTLNIIVPVIGFILIVFSMFFINSKMNFPGYIAMVPVAGTAMIVCCGNDSCVGRLLSNKLFVFIGLISYPLYLWHWPLIVFYKLKTASDIDLLNGIFIIFASMILAFLSFYLVERKVRFGKHRGYNAAVSAIILFIVGQAGLYVYKHNGIQDRKINEIAKEYSSIINVYDFFDYPNLMRSNKCHSVTPEVAVSSGCVAKSDNQIFIWGDSYAAALYSGLKNVSDKYYKDVFISQMTDGNGPPFYFDNRKTDTLKTLTDANNERLNFVEMYKPKKIIISWMVEGQNAIFDKNQAILSLNETIKKIKFASPESKIIVVGPVPEWDESLIKQIVLYYTNNHNEPPRYMKDGLKPQIKEWDDFLKKNIPTLGVDYVSPYSAMCGDGGCLTRTSEGPKGITAVDWGHLTEAGSTYIVDKYRKEIFE